MLKQLVMNVDISEVVDRQDLVLIGGGHSHAIVLKLWGMKPIPGVRLTLISAHSHTPYSGMLPGHVAGFYTYDQTHIDLRRLTGYAKANFYLDRVTGLDLVHHQLFCQNHPPVSFDYLSLDIGSTPTTINVPGAGEYAIPAKPVPQFLTAWERIVTTANHHPHQPLSLSIVGGGAGGVELALNMQVKLKAISHLEIHLFQRGKQLLPGHNSWVSHHLQQILIQRGIKLHLNQIVTEVLPKQIICASGLKLKSDHIFWVTQATAPSWIKTSGLITDDRGFILVNNYLQSISHPQVFATGDIATMENYPRPKAGVFAVRQGKPLFQNLQNIFLDKKLVKYIPQKLYLSLIGTGDKKAIASWSYFGGQSSLLWTWKDYIDRQFMQRFSNLPPMVNKGANDTIEIPKMHCAGCGSKIGSTILAKALKRLEITENQDIVIGLNQADDAAIVRVPPDQLMVHTVDYFPSLIDDPFIFGQIATNHCLSDIFTMGATPQSALAIVTIPYATPEIIEETLYQLLAGVNKILQQSQTALIGGHTIEGKELAFGLACNGLISPDKIMQKSGMKPGELLILTKAIGTGTLFAANQLYQAKGRWIDGAVKSMLLSNQLAAKILLEHQISACTDVTGFGLLGHLLEMVQASQVAVELNLDEIPILSGAIETIEMGITSSLHSQNLQASCYLENSAKVSHLAKYQLLFDPQTSGGLLASLPANNAESCLKVLQQYGYHDAKIIGKILPKIKNSSIWII